MTNASEKKPRLKMKDVEDAFRQAQDELGTQWQLTGRGYHRRVTLQSHIVRPATAGAGQAFTSVCINRNQRCVFPYEIVARAADILGVRFDEITGVVDSAGYAPTPPTRTVEVDIVPAANPLWRRPSGKGKRP